MADTKVTDLTAASSVAPTDFIYGVVGGNSRKVPVGILPGGKDVADLAALLSDTALTYTVGQAGTVSSGGVIRTRAEGFSYEVAASASADQHVTTAGGVKLYVLTGQDGYAPLDAFGTDGTKVGDSVAIRKAFLSGHPVRAFNKRYFYDGVNIATDHVILHGSAMPKPNSGRTTLVGGTIFQGKLSFSSLNADLRDFGVDLGADTGEAADDGLKCTTTLNAGGHLHVENITALLPGPDSAFHSLLFESYQRLTGGNLFGIHGYFGCVIKCQNVDISAIRTGWNSSDGLYLKSDINFGQCRRVNIGSVNVFGGSAQTFGVRIQAADGVIIEDVQINKVIVRDCATPVILQCLGDSPITNVSLGRLLLITPSARALHSSAGTSIIQGLAIDQIAALNVPDVGIEFEGTHKFVSIQQARVIYASGTAQAQWNKGVIVGSAVQGTVFGSVVVNQAYVLSSVGAIQYNNPTWKLFNEIGAHSCVLKGSGKPAPGFTQPADTGAGVAIYPSYNRREKNSLVKAKPTANTTVTAIDIFAVAAAELFDPGYILTVVNDSAFTYTVNHSIGGKIVNQGAAAVAIPTNEARSWVFGGAVWHQI